MVRRGQQQAHTNMVQVAQRRPPLEVPDDPVGYLLLSGSDSDDGSVEQDPGLRALLKIEGVDPLLTDLVAHESVGRTGRLTVELVRCHCGRVEAASLV